MMQQGLGFWIGVVVGLAAGVLIAFVTTVAVMLLLYAFHQERLGRDIIKQTRRDLKNIVRKAVAGWTINVRPPDPDEPEGYFERYRPWTPEDEEDGD